MAKGRPKGISAFTILMALVGILSIIMMLLMWFLSSVYSNWSSDDILVSSSVAIPTILIGIVVFILAVLIYNFNKIAFVLTLIVMTLDAYVSLPGALDGHIISLITLALYLIILIYLVAIAKRFFEIAKMTPGEKAKEGIFNDFFEVFSDVFVVFVIIIVEIFAIALVMAKPGEVCRPYILPTILVVVLLTILIFYRRFTER